MVTFTYKNLDAKEISQKMIEVENALMSTDFYSLDFEGKCKYLIECASLGHPARNSYREFDELFASFKTELFQRLAEGECMALCCVGTLGHSLDMKKEMRLEYLRRATKSDDIFILSQYLSYKRLFGPEESDGEMAKQLLERLRDMTPDVQTLRAELSCCLLLSKLTRDTSYKSQVREKRYQLAKLGRYGVLFAIFSELKRRLKGRLSAEEREDAELELSFWSTVKYLVLDHYSKRGISRHEHTLATQLYTGQGCEVDLERVIRADVTYFVTMEAEPFSERIAERLRERISALTDTHPIRSDLLCACLCADQTAIVRLVSDAVHSGQRTEVIQAYHELMNARFIAHQEAKSEEGSPEFSSEFLKNTN